MNRAIINGKTSCIECNVCGASEKMVLPASIEAFCEQGKVFGKAHEDCKPERFCPITCGGCGCHINPPCVHCLEHIPGES